MSVVPVTVGGGAALRALAEIRITPASPRPEAAAEKIADILGDLLMDSLQSDDAVIDPIVGTDLDAQAVDISFEFAAAGVLEDDSRRAME